MVQGTEPAGRLLTWVDRPENYRPLTMLRFAANRRLGASATGFHLVNVLLHALVSVLAFEVARVVLRSSMAGARNETSGKRRSCIRPDRWAVTPRLTGHSVSGSPVASQE